MESKITFDVTTDPLREDIVDRHEKGFQIIEIRLSEPLLVGHSIDLKPLPVVLHNLNTDISNLFILYVGARLLK